MAITGAVVTAAPAQASGESLKGYIRDSTTNVGIVDVDVTIIYLMNGDRTTVQTGNGGYYHFDSVPIDGDYIAYIDARNVPGANYAAMYYPTTPFFNNAEVLALTNSSGLQRDMVLSPGGSLSGTLSFSSTPQNMYISVLAYNADDGNWQFVQSSPAYGTLPWTFEKLPPGHYKLRYADSEAPLPSYPTQHHDNILDINDVELFTVVAGGNTSGINHHMTEDLPSNVARLAGANRFETSARIAMEFGEASVVFVANGLGYPDALSAAPAAAYLNAPLLLTMKDSLPAEVKAQIERLNPDTIYVVGGTGVISTAVFNELNALAGVGAQRLAGSNRYTTSQEVFSTIWDGNIAEYVFLADGRNFPDALSSASAAAKQGGPVVLVNGGSSALPTGLSALLQSALTTDVIIAGGAAVVSNAIMDDAEAVPGVSASRHFGADRYATSAAVNDAFFGPTQPVFLAVGTGYADALAGAALAGSQFGPLYLVPGNCVSQDVLDRISSLATSRVVVLGGTGVLNAAVENLTSCTPTS
jgi:putative cell wall-binding protein